MASWNRSVRVNHSRGQWRVKSTDRLSSSSKWTSRLSLTTAPTVSPAADSQRANSETTPINVLPRRDSGRGTWSTRAITHGIRALRVEDGPTTRVAGGPGPVSTWAPSAGERVRHGTLRPACVPQISVWRDRRGPAPSQRERPAVPAQRVVVLRQPDRRGHLEPGAHAGPARPSGDQHLRPVDRVALDRQLPRPPRRRGVHRSRPTGGPDDS